MKLSKCFRTLLYSWGSDTPAEAIWAANDFIKYLTPKYPVLEGKEFNEITSDEEAEQNSELLNLIKTLDNEN